MAPLQNGASNGVASGDDASAHVSTRFSDVPSAIEVPVQGDQEDEAVEIDLEDLGDDPTELCTLFENERAAKPYWMTVALAYAKQGKVDHAIEMLHRGSGALQAGGTQNNQTVQRDKVSMICCLCWMYLWKSREAPRVAPEGTRVSEAKTKDYYLQQATSSLNDAARLNPSFSPMYLARGVLLLLRASLQAPPKTAGGTGSEKAELLKTAIKAFEDALRISQGKNMLALMGKARALFSMQKYSDSLAAYQDVLLKRPDLVDPDPRLGIGCCFWQLGFKEDAKVAWERSLEINPDSKIANILLGQFYLDASSHVPVNSDSFLKLYKKAMTEYTQKSFKLDKELPLTCSTFASYFLSRKAWDNADKLAHKAIQYTDVNAIASDGWYLLAKKEHYHGNSNRASDYYRRADDARGGADLGYLPAKFGVAQLSVLQNDLGEAKLRLEKMIQQSRNYEAMILLGTLYAEEIFASQNSDSKEDKSAEMKKAFNLLEGVRSFWKDQTKNMAPDASVLLNLARLYETENPEKALQCLQQVEQLEIDQIPESEYPKDTTDEAEMRLALRKFLPPQLLNNIGCFHFQAEKFEPASEMFEAALSACMLIGERDSTADTDALVSTISFNLGRSYEARNLTDKAVEVYDGLLARHDDYTDARARLAYIKLRQHPNKEGPDAVAKLYQENTGDVEVRSLYGWYLGKVHSRKRPSNVAEDQEFRHYKHTLQNYDKHDRYALVAMGNLYLTQAREMRRETDQEKQKRSATYAKAVEFFEKALSLDPKNAYAAQGIAIAMIEDKKDLKNALPIFNKIRDTIKDSHLYVNLGHIFAELRQFTKAIEHYEIALTKDGKANDPVILACLGRTWLNRGRAERDIEAYNRALECAKKVCRKPETLVLGSNKSG
jgi:RNA polymerase-associated protein CTR9